MAVTETIKPLLEEEVSPPYQINSMFFAGDVNALRKIHPAPQD
jgi:hypothetical protein